ISDVGHRNNSCRGAKGRSAGFSQTGGKSCHWSTAPTKEPISSNANTALFATTALFLLLSVRRWLLWLPAQFSNQHPSALASTTKFGSLVHNSAEPIHLRAVRRLGGSGRNLPL